MCGGNKSQQLQMLFIAVVMTIGARGTAFNARRFPVTRIIQSGSELHSPATLNQTLEVRIKFLFLDKMKHKILGTAHNTTWKNKRRSRGSNEKTRDAAKFKHISATTAGPGAGADGATKGAPGVLKHRKSGGGAAAALESVNRAVIHLTKILVALPGVGILDSFNPFICKGSTHTLTPAQMTLCQAIDDAEKSMESTPQRGNGNEGGAATFESVKKTATAAYKILVALITSGIVENFNTAMCYGTEPLGPAHQDLCNAISIRLPSTGKLGFRQPIDPMTALEALVGKH